MACQQGLGRSILWAVIRSMPSTSTTSLDRAPGSREEILRKLRERIVGFAASRMQRDAAEDLAQEVLILLHEKYRDLDRLEDLLPLSLKIVRFKMLAHRRKARRHGEFTQVSPDEIQMPDGRTDALTAMEQREAREGLVAAISKLGERCRKLLALKLEGKSFAEIQTIFGVSSINTIYTWDFRCRQQLIQNMREDE
jgi:RNA polymerase sigma-70 factor (ECF subfamily)